MRNQFGSFLKKARLRTGLGLRDFCILHRFDPGNYSRIERGLFGPPQSQEQLEKYAQALGLQRGVGRMDRNV